MRFPAPAVDVGRLQANRFGDPQTRAVAGGEDRAMLDAVEAAEKPPDFVGAENDGQLRRRLRGGRSYASTVHENVSRGWCARSLAIARSISLICDLWRFAFSRTRREPTHRGPLWRPSAWNERRCPMFPHRALRRDAIWCPVSEACWMSGRREYGYAGLRDA